MLAIHSFFKNTSDLRIRSDIELTARQANLSYKFLKKHKFTTILYTDKSCIGYFKHIPYDNIITLDISDLKPNIPKYYWSASKLISCSVTNEPYFHIDTDLFLIENHIQNFVDSKFFLFHEEPWYKYIPNIIPKINNLFDYISPNSLSYNNAIFGGKNYLDLNKHIINLIDSVIKNHTNIANILKEDKKKCKAVFMEQYLFDNLIKKELNIIEIPLIIKESTQAKNKSDIYRLLRQYNIVHLWINKGIIESTVGINNLLDTLEKKHF
jgi:hypothetical protein